MTAIIYHNPKCGTSRQVLAILQAAGAAPQVVEYLKAGWNVPQLQALFAAAGITPRAALRTRGTPAAELGLLAEDVGDDAILAAMAAHPGLVERPFVQTERGTRLCRPKETVRALLSVPADQPIMDDTGKVLLAATAG